MKPLFYSKTLIALAVAIAATAGQVSQAQEQPIPPPSENGLPPNIPPGSPVAEVVKLVQAGTEAGLIKIFITNCKGSFDLDAEKIIALTDLGVPAAIINAMMAHDRMLSAPMPAATATTMVASPAVTAPPTTEVTVNYFDNTLMPYGSWVEIEGYGRCWRPTVGLYDSGWQPYRERGHWVYSDCGWYWDSEYSWGVTFHYGRWFQHPRWGWCWWPDTVWSPSWVTWRSSDDYCGWAPLPPFAVYRPGGGFYYRGTSVSVGFDFGLPAACFTFISPSHFCAPHLRYYCVEPRRNIEIFHQTTIINSFSEHRDGGHRDVMVNRGIPLDHINRYTHSPIQPVRVGEIHNAERQGWHGNDIHRGEQHSGIGSPAESGGHNTPGGGPQRHDGGEAEHHQGASNAWPNNGKHSLVVDQTVNQNPGATAATFNQAERVGQAGGGQNHNQPMPTVGAPVNQGSSPAEPSQPSAIWQNENHNNQSENHWNNHNNQAGNRIPLGNHSGATAATFNRAERNGPSAGGINQNRPAAPADSVILVGPPKVTPAQTAAVNLDGNPMAPSHPAAAWQNENHGNRSENHWNNHNIQADNSIPLGNNFGATAATFNRAERGGQTIGGQNHYPSAPSVGIPVGNNFGATAATFNRAERANRMNNNHQPSPPVSLPVVGAPANLSPPVQFHAPEHSVQLGSPPQNHNHEQAAAVAPASQPQGSDQSSDHNSGNDKDRDRKKH